MAKLGIALGSGPRGRGFESRHSDQGKGLLQKTNLRQALIYIHFHTEDRILAQIVENFSHFGHAYAGSTVLVGPES